MQRQRALAHASLARADRDEVPHGAEAVIDAAALLGNLLEDSGPPVADYVVISLHVASP
jgi:hypothetical protein